MEVDRSMSWPGLPARQVIRLRRWREGKVRPIPGNSPHDRPVSRGISSSLKESLRRSLPHHRIPQQFRIILGAQYAFSKACRNLSGPMGLNFKSKNQSQNQILGRDHTASRWSAPSPGKRTRREEHALSHRPQMMAAFFGDIATFMQWTQPKGNFSGRSRSILIRFPALRPV